MYMDGHIRRISKGIITHHQRHHHHHHHRKHQRRRSQSGNSDSHLLTFDLDVNIARSNIEIDLQMLGL